MTGQHGFARTQKWKLLNESESSSSCTFMLEYNEITLKLWPYKFNLLYTVSLRSEGLHVRFEVQNCDESDFQFTALLHTYFNIESINSVKIEGFNGLQYADKLKNNETSTEDRQVIEKINDEVDRNYFNVPHSVQMKCSAGEFQIQSDFKDLGKHKI